MWLNIQTEGLGEMLEEILAEAMARVKVDTEIMHIVAEDNGQANALDQALCKALL